MSDKPSVLFVCIHNAGRSQMAAGFLAALWERLGPEGDGGTTCFAKGLVGLESAGIGSWPPRPSLPA